MNAHAILFGMLKGKKINQYQLKSLLGAGGFGAVFLADEVVRDRVIRQVAVKVIVPDSNPDRQFNELIASTTLRHPHLLEAYGAGDYKFNGDELIYLVMELAGAGLDKRLAGGNKLSVAETRQLVTEVAKALIYLHEKPNGKVHRDLKPANILRVGNIWKVSDLGLIRDMDDGSRVFTNNVAGTVPYMPHESFDGEISSAWDIWSLGITIVEVLTGGIPYVLQHPNQLQKKVMNADITIPQLPAPFDEIVRGCLQKVTTQVKEN